MTVQELIAALEAATGPDRELDLAIHRAAWDLAYPAKAGRMPKDLQIRYPHYTGSIDGPRGLSDWLLCYASDIGADGLALVKLGDPGQTPSVEVSGIHSSLEIAWCIAALKARNHVR